MKVLITVETPGLPPVRDIYEVAKTGDLESAVGRAFAAFRSTHPDIPLQEFSTTKVERL